MTAVGADHPQGVVAERALLIGRIGKAAFVRLCEELPR